MNQGANVEKDVEKRQDLLEQKIEMKFSQIQSALTDMKTDVSELRSILSDAVRGLGKIDHTAERLSRLESDHSATSARVEQVRDRSLVWSGIAIGLSMMVGVCSGLAVYAVNARFSDAESSAHRLEIDGDRRATRIEELDKRLRELERNFPKETRS